jgi:hypothetical protein
MREDLETTNDQKPMTPQPHPYRPHHRPHHQQPSSPSHAPASSPSNGYPSVTGGDGAAHQVGRTPNVGTRFPASTTAVSQADGEA